MTGIPWLPHEVNNLEGIGPRWNDWKFPLSQLRQGALAKPDFDFTNVGYLMPQNDAGEILYAADQTDHGVYIQGDLYPHVHWRQTKAGQPVFKLAYKLWDNGEEEPADFTMLTANTSVFQYVSGNIAQISAFPAISCAHLKSVSAQLVFKFYREDNVVAGDILVRSVDFHHLLVARGSLQQYIQS